MGLPEVMPLPSQEHPESSAESPVIRQARKILREQFPSEDAESLNFIQEETDEKGFTTAVVFSRPGNPFNPETIFRVPIPAKPEEKVEVRKMAQVKDFDDTLKKKRRGV
jgi:hypothetical protein